MDVKSGHPGAIFTWLFETQYGEDNNVKYLAMLYGVSRDMMNLLESCLQRQPEFNDCLSEEILFCFFNPEVNVSRMHQDAKDFRQVLNRLETGKFVYSSGGVARPLPDGMIEIKREHFRSESPDDYYFDKISTQIARAHAQSMTFFKEAFGIPAKRNALILACRFANEIRIYDVGSPIDVDADDLLNCFAALQSVSADEYTGNADFIDRFVLESLNSAALRHTVKRGFSELRKISPW